ncbi:MAG: hypothetical protein ACTSQO_03540 [Candidatus Helarchaeota archaeon]
MDPYEDTKNLIKNVECSDSNEKGYVTINYLRNILELSQKIKNFNEFKLRVGYMTVKNEGNRTNEIREFYTELMNYLIKNNINDMEKVSEIIEFIIMHFTIKKAGLVI